jgi:hypothetical protein
MKGILHGFRVNDFLYQVDLLARQAQNNSEWKEILNSFSTIDAYDFILGKLKPVSLAFYSKQMKKSPEQKAIQQTIDSCLAERGQCMSEFLNVKNKSEHMSLKHWFRFWTIGHKLRVADSKAKKLNAFMYSERKKSLSEEIAYAKKQNDSSHMWQCTKALAGKPLHSHNGQIRMSADEWKEGMCRAASLGGTNASVIEDFRVWSKQVEHEHLQSKNFRDPSSPCPLSAPFSQGTQPIFPFNLYLPEMFTLFVNQILILLSLFLPNVNSCIWKIPAMHHTRSFLRLSWQPKQLKVVQVLCPPSVLI